MVPMKIQVAGELMCKTCLGVEKDKDLFTDHDTLITYNSNTRKEQELNMSAPFELHMCDGVLLDKDMYRTQGAPASGVLCH